MRRHVIIVLVGSGLILGAALAFGGSTKPEVLIDRAFKVFASPGAPRETILDALIGVLDASVLILPGTDYAEEFRARIEAVKAIYASGQLFSDKARQYLGLSYKLVSGGRSWKIPEELVAGSGTTDITVRAWEVCRNLLESARAERSAGRNVKAVRDLLAFVIMVITPIEA